MNIIEKISSVLEKEGINTPDSQLLAEKIYGVMVHSYHDGFQVTAVARAKRRTGIRKLLVEYRAKNISGILEQLENLDN